jgi:hypothetical protein
MRNRSKNPIGNFNPPKPQLITPYVKAALIRPAPAPSNSASPSTRARIWTGRKPSTLSTANSVRRSRTLMLIALAITRDRLARHPGAKSHRIPQMMSRKASSQEAMLEEAVSHFTGGVRSCGADSICLATWVKAGVSGTFSQTRLRRRSDKRCFRPL